MGQTTRLDWQGGVDVVSGGLKYTSRFGTSPAPSGLLAMADGTATGQVNSVFEAAFSILAGANLDYDLKGGNGEVDVLNVLLAMTNVNGVEVILTTTPAAGVSIRLGPQNVTNGAQLWFSAATATFYDTVRDRFAMIDQATGWALDATHKVIRLNNPGAGTVAGWIRILGRK